VDAFVKHVGPYDKQALFELPSEQLTAQLQAAAGLELANTPRFNKFISFLAGEEIQTDEKEKLVKFKLCSVLWGRTSLVICCPSAVKNRTVTGKHTVIVAERAHNIWKYRV
jgi:hypothetical protein